MNAADLNSNSLVIWQKGKSQNGCYKKTKPAKFSEKTIISYPLTCTPREYGMFVFRKI